MVKQVFRVSLALGASLLASTPGFTVPNTFHLMQIEQVIGGVNGNQTRQAIQLRMRAAGQNLVSFSRVRAWDAAGANPVLIVDMGTNVANGATGSRVLIASAGFLPGLTPDFVMTNLIPPSYLNAGKLTFEDDSGTQVLWSLAWGGAGYTGTNLGTLDNDADGNFNPPFGQAMPSAGTSAVLFPGAATAPSTNNLADYILTPGAAVFTNNAGANGTVPVDLMDFTVR
jgi:hypothetical protein